MSRRLEASESTELEMSSSIHILYVENDAADAELVQETLAAEGIACSVARVETEHAFLMALQEGGFDLILADYTLPSFDGLSALRIARQEGSNVPFIFVSGTLGEEVAIEALKIGATDYVLKTRLSRLVPSVQRALREATERAELRRSEEALHRSETYLAIAQSLSHTGSFGWDLSNGEIFWSQETFRIFELDPMTKPTLEFILQRVHPGDRVLLKETLDRISHDRTEFHFEHRLLMSDRRIKYLRVSGRAAQDPSSSTDLVGAVTDITSAKQAERELAGEKRILEMVAKGDSLHEILDGLCRLVEEQAGGVLTSILLVDGDRLRHGGAPSLPKDYTDAIDGGVIGPTEGSCGTAAYRGEQVIVEDIATDPLWTKYRKAALPHSLRACWSTPIFSSERKVIGTFAMYYRESRSPNRRDREIIEQITHLAGVAIERKLTFEQLQRSEAYLAEAQKLSNMGSWAWDPSKKNRLYWSEEMFRICGLEPRLEAPDCEEASNFMSPDDNRRVSASIMKAVREKADFVEEQRLVLPDGTLKHIQLIGHPVLDETGDITEYVGTMRDVTELKRAEQERERLHQLEADLAHIQRVSMMGELAASLSHELRQPLTAAIADAHACLLWLSRDEPNLDEARESALRIIRDSRGAAEIIDRTRELYKKSPPRRELVDVNEIVGEILVLLRGETKRYSTLVSTELAPDLPKIAADRVQLQQVFMNLMLNGIEAMEDSSGELTIKSQLYKDGQVMISISDTGVGLPAEKADQIFEAFFTTKPQGSGMGLAITRSIVESHGGYLWAAANSAQGTTFHFTLPIQLEMDLAELTPRP